MSDPGFVYRLKRRLQKPNPHIPNQGTTIGRVMAWLGWPCEFMEHCAYYNIWDCGHERFNPLDKGEDWE